MEHQIPDQRVETIPTPTIASQKYPGQSQYPGRAVEQRLFAGGLSSHSGTMRLSNPDSKRSESGESMSSVPPEEIDIRGTYGETETLDQRYRRQMNHAEFFVVGKVFAILWHENVGASNVTKSHTPKVAYTTEGRYGEQIFSHIRRMVVVRRRYGYSWCISINTYGGQGVAKRGLTSQAIHANAIIYDAAGAPFRAPGEPTLTNHPIAVSLSPGQQLDQMSRLDYSKVHTVEHNVKAMDIGRVTNDSMPYLVAQWRQEMEGQNEENIVERPQKDLLTPSASSISQPTRATVFESQLSGLLHEFASIESGDYRACYAFARNNSDIWDCDERNLLRDAYAALLANRESHAKRCIQRAVMIQECSELSPSEIKAFFDGLINKKKRALEDFLVNCNDATANIKTKPPFAIDPSPKRPAPQDPDSLLALESMSLQGGYFRNPAEQRHLDQVSESTAKTRQDMSGPSPPQSGYPRNTSELRSIDQFPGPTFRMHQNAPQSLSLQREIAWNTDEQRSVDQFPKQKTRIQQDLPAQREQATAYEAAAGAAAKAAAGAVADRLRVMSDVPTVPDTNIRHMIDTIDGRYRIRTSSAVFFTFGRVFATPWHTTLGENQLAALRNSNLRDWVVKDCFGGSILTHIQRMVVVKEGYGFSWCVFINTYQGKGVAKSGLSRTDRLAHAIIYMSGTDAKEAPAEKDMMEKAPIAVSAASLDQKLDVMSRINFGKVYTIDHNVKVMDVGRISREDMRNFKDCWNQHR